MNNQPGYSPNSPQLPSIAKWVLPTVVSSAIVMAIIFTMAIASSIRLDNYTVAVHKQSGEMLFSGWHWVHPFQDNWQIYIVNYYSNEAVDTYLTKCERLALPLVDEWHDIKTQVMFSKKIKPSHSDSARMQAKISEYSKTCDPSIFFKSIP